MNNKASHPIMSSAPPTGVAEPIAFTRDRASTQSDTEKRATPATKLQPAIRTVRVGVLGRSHATTISAGMWYNAYDTPVSQVAASFVEEKRDLNAWPNTPHDTATNANAQARRKKVGSRSCIASTAIAAWRFCSNTRTSRSVLSLHEYVEGCRTALHCPERSTGWGVPFSLTHSVAMTQSFGDWLTGCCASRKKHVPTDSDKTIEASQSSAPSHKANDSKVRAAHLNVPVRRLISRRCRRRRPQGLTRACRRRPRLVLTGLLTLKTFRTPVRSGLTHVCALGSLTIDAPSVRR